MASKHINLLEELLRETRPANGEENFDKIKELVAAAAQARRQESDVSKVTEEYFKVLRMRIDQSSTYLEKAKKDLENINYAYEQERIRQAGGGGADYNEFVNKTDEEIDQEMEQLKSQLASLEKKVKRLNQNTYGAEDNYNKSIKTLQNINMCRYTDDIES